MGEKLLCCPFCGGIPEVQSCRYRMAPAAWISCMTQGCEVETSVFTTRGEAIRMWNTRAPDPSKKTLAEALEWYASTVASCRKIHREGEVARAALSSDGGGRAREALRLYEEGEK